MEANIKMVGRAIGQALKILLLEEGKVTKRTSKKFFDKIDEYVAKEVALAEHLTSGECENHSIFGGNLSDFLKDMKDFKKDLENDLKTEDEGDGADKDNETIRDKDVVEKTLDGDATTKVEDIKEKDDKEIIKEINEDKTGD